MIGGCCSDKIIKISTHRKVHREHAGAINVNVAHSRLLVELVQIGEIGVAETLEGLGLGGGGIEIGLCNV